MQDSQQRNTSSSLLCVLVASIAQSSKNFIFYLLIQTVQIKLVVYHIENSQNLFTITKELILLFSPIAKQQLLHHREKQAQITTFTRVASYIQVMEINFFQQIEYSFDKHTENHLKMHLSAFHLFSDITPGLSQLIREIEKPILRDIFTVSKTEIVLILTENFVVLYNHQQFKTPTHFCPLTFDLKFETLYESIPNQTCLGIPTSIKFQREGCPQQLVFHPSNPTIAEKWSIELQKKINQRNFHKLFKAKRKIGKGAFATVYLAQRLRDHKMVAVKAFSKEKQYAGDKGKQSLENEIKLMRQLNHMNIMKLEGVYQTQNSIYVILEYLEGPQLNQILKDNKNIQEHQIKRIIQSILRGLSHLSNHHIIHRDLKPENILFKRKDSWEVAICDFGLATFAHEENYLFVRCGTPGFVAPEIINIRDMSTKSRPISDIFSVGIIFHYLLFGCSVFQGKKYNEILSQNRQCDFDFSSQIYNKISSKAFDLLAKMLEKDPNRRISADEALNHGYFMNDMDIEFSQRILLKNTSLDCLNKKKRDYNQTLSFNSRRGEDKAVLNQMIDEARYRYL